ncbi:uncharacterized protein [Parasteatoda tepidariorum]|uniref:uncharacterized protein n=1 Tax=Parasteatoda tepidariorum TaxID=114398 RepID=UPI001C71B74E|nr:uncharacterized protein LOC107449232 [Parasteatoda tepidariorum]
MHVDSTDTSASSVSSPTPQHRDGLETINILSFLNRITDELSFHFKRNAVKEGYCDNIYDQVFFTPSSGSLSYYKDLVAQSSNSSAEVELPNQAQQFKKTVTEQKIFYCSSSCTGYRNSSIGAGPLEDLFQVLRPNINESYASKLFLGDSANLAAFSNTDNGADYDWQQLTSDGDDFSDFIDILRQWPSESYQEPFPTYDTSVYNLFDD